MLGLTRRTLIASGAAALASTALGGRPRPEAPASGRLGYREGRWKAVMIPPPSGTGRWQLYDLASDPDERTDLSDPRSARLKTMIAGLQAWAFENGVLLPSLPGL